LRASLLFAVSSFLAIIDTLEVGVTFELLVPRESGVLFIVVAASEAYSLSTSLAAIASDPTCEDSYVTVGTYSFSFSIQISNYL